MKFKNPHSVLVVIYAQSTNRVLMLQRLDDLDFWQSVTGSLEIGETPLAAAKRELAEEVGLKTPGNFAAPIVVYSSDLGEIQGELFDCQTQVEFEIFPHFRYKYAPEITHCREHWFLLAMRDEFTPRLSEHRAFQWLDATAASALTKSPNNAAAIRQYLIEER